MNWQVQSPTIPQNIDQLIQLILANRHQSSAADFLTPLDPIKNFEAMKKSIAGWTDDYLAPALKLLQQAIDQHQSVVIFGDYDADGICAATIIWWTLKKLGLTARPFIPDRQLDGYGITPQTLTKIFAEQKPDLLITVDNGIVANQAVAMAVEAGVKVLLTDHHQPTDTLPPATAIVQTTQICGAAVAWLLMMALEPRIASEYLDLAAIATITDQMPLVGVNRSLVKFGLAAMADTHNLGLKALFKVAQLDINQVTPEMIGFVIGPRLNAAGRLATGLEAMRLLCTNSATSALKLATTLDQYNQSRQNLTTSQQKLAQQLIGEHLDQPILLAASENFHEGIIGLIAGRLTETYHRPSVVISLAGQIGKGSARSIPGVDITQLLRTTADLLLDLGGHQLAAGFSIDRRQLTKFQTELLSQAAKKISPALLEPTITVDCQLPEELVNLETAMALAQLAPFGLGNLPAKFLLPNLLVKNWIRLGTEGKHLKLLLAPATNLNEEWTALLWNQGEKSNQLQKNLSVIDLVAQLDINIWRQRQSLQLMASDFKLSS